MKIRLLKVKTYDIRRDTMEVICGEFEVISGGFEGNKLEMSDEERYAEIEKERTVFQGDVEE